jgi:hypothetical protein
MKHVVFAGALALTLFTAAAPVMAQAGQAPKPGTSLGTVHIANKVTLGGMPLAAGDYQVRLATDQAPQPGVGQTPDAEQYVEFLRGGKVVGKEVATVVSNADIGTIAKGKRPGPGASSVELLKGNDYVRVWINRGGQNYIIHLPATAS